jgi:hypothetical protein
MFNPAISSPFSSDSRVDSVFELVAAQFGLSPLLDRERNLKRPNSWEPPWSVDLALVAFLPSERPT